MKEQIKISGSCAEAIVMTENLEEAAFEQIKNLCSERMFIGEKIRIMPDVHAGKGCVIGFTSTAKDKIVPNLIGMDISCSVSVHRFKIDKVDFKMLDKTIRDHIPHGQMVRNEVSSLVTEEFKNDLFKVCQDIGDLPSYERHLNSIGTLGGGNHFIEICKGHGDNLFLTIHSGSRNFGAKICTYHQNKAIKNSENIIQEKIKTALENTNLKDREATLKSIKNEVVKKELAYLEGDDLLMYTKHLKVAQEFARLSHLVMAKEITDNMGWCIENSFVTNHNYVEFFDDDMMIRKGAVSAKKGELLIIPMNMRDGSLICIGKGNKEWNESAPHGAGRLFSRTAAKNKFTIEDFEKEMDGIWSTCVSNSTLDESPMAYKNMREIIDNIEETVEIVEVIKPLYNFKSK